MPENRLVLFGKTTDRLRSDWWTPAFAYGSQQTPFHLPHVTRSSVATHLFSIPRVKPALTELAKQRVSSVLFRSDTVGFVHFPIDLGLLVFYSLTCYSYYPVFLTESYPLIFYSPVLTPTHPSLLPRLPACLPACPSPLIPPSSFLKATCSQPVWLSCTLPMKGFLLGWDWVQPSRAWLELRLGPGSPPRSPTAQPHSTCLFWSGPVAQKEITCLCCP